MARRAKQPARELNPGQATYIVERLISERRVSASEINRYLGEMQAEIKNLEQRLQSLRAASDGGKRSSSGSGSASAQAAAPVRRRRRSRGATKSAPGQATQSASAPAARKSRKRGRKSSKTAPEVMASRQLQGRYLALVRQIPQTRRAQFSKIAKEKSREAAIKEMTDYLKK